MEYGFYGSTLSSPVTGQEDDSSRELLTSNLSPVLNEVSDQDAFESVESPVDRAWLLSFCYLPAEK